MRRTRAWIILIVAIIACTLSCGLLMTGGECPPPQAHPTTQWADLDALSQTLPGEPFEIRLAAVDLNSYAANRIARSERSLISAFNATFRRDTITLDMCARRVLLRPVVVHVELDVRQDSARPAIICVAGSIGRIRLPRPALSLLAGWLNRQWASLKRLWRIERWAVTEDSLYVASIRY